MDTSEEILHFDTAACRANGKSIKEWALLRRSTVKTMKTFVDFKDDFYLTVIYGREFEYLDLVESRNIHALDLDKLNEIRKTKQLLS